MAIRSFTFDPCLADAFVRLGYSLYAGDEKRIPPSKRRLRAQLSPEFPFHRRPGNRHRHFIVARAGTTVGRISAFVNRDVRDRDGSAVGGVGFFECVDDYAVAEELFDAAVGWVRKEAGVDRIWGPIDFDIWHGYRLMTRGFGESPFHGEPYNHPYYPVFFERYGFVAKHHWHSVETVGRDSLETLIAPAQKGYEQLRARGYRFRSFETANFEQSVSGLHTVLTGAFSKAIAFTPISIHQFRELFTALPEAIHPRLLTLVYDGRNDLVGFAGAFRDLAEAVRAARGEDGLRARLRYIRALRAKPRILFYLCGSIPDATDKHADFGKAVFYHTIRRILDEGYETILIALMSRASAMTRMVGRDTTMAQRQYTLYELTR